MYFKPVIGLLLVLIATPIFGVETYTEKVNKITWTYKIVNGDAWVGAGSYLSSRAVPESTSGSITVPSNLGGKQVRGISSYAFEGCTNLTSVTIPNVVTNIGWYAFERCKALKTINIPNSVAAIGVGAFHSCRTLTSVTIPDGVVDVRENTFYHCDNLKTVSMPNSVTNIERFAFEYCTNLTNVTMPTHLRSIGQSAFYECTRIEYVRIVDMAAWCQISFYNAEANPLYYAHNIYNNNSLIVDLTIPTGVVNIQDRAFDGCTCITNVTIPNSVKNIGRDAFRGCNGLTNVSVTDIEGWFRITFVNTYSDPLYYARNMYLNGVPVTDLRIPEGVTNVSASIIRACNSLTAVTIPSTIMSLDERAFTGCSKRRSFTVASSNPSFKSENGILLTKDGKTVICGVNGDVTIPDGATIIGQNAFAGCSELTRVSIPYSVETIGDGAFRNCNNVREVSVPGWQCDIPFDSVTNLVISDGTTEVLDWAFWQCRSLMNVTIPDSVRRIGDTAFNSCSGLIHVTVGDGVEAVGEYAFGGCTNLAYVHISNIGNWCGISFGNESANPLYYAHKLYVGDEAVREMIIPEGVNTIKANSFYGYSSLTSVSIPESITCIESNAFVNCNGLTAVHISDVAAWCGITFENPEANPLNYARHLYLNEDLLTDLIIPDVVTEIEAYAFQNCSDLTSVKILGSNMRVGENAFAGCSEVTDVMVPGWQCGIPFGSVTNLVISDGVTHIGDGAFSSCNGLSSIMIPGNVKHIGRVAFASCRNLVYVLIADGVESIGEKAFFGSSELTSITMPNSVTNIGSAAFYGCRKIMDVTIPQCIASASTSSMFHMSSVFYSSYQAITNVIVSEGVVNIGRYAFNGCSSLTNVSIPDSVTNIGQYAFNGCNSLFDTTTIPGVNMVDEWAINGNSFLSYEVYLTGVRGIAEQAFRSCYSLTNVIIGSDVANICDGAFVNCKGLMSFTVEEGNPYYMSSAGLLLKKDTNTLVAGVNGDVTIPNEVTTIGDGAFYGYSELTRVTIPDSVTRIGGEAFRNCTGLTNIVFDGNVPQVGLSCFSGVSQDCKGEISRFTIGWGTPISRTWNGLLITYPWYSVEFDAAGGSCPEESRAVDHGLVIGDLPTPVKVGYTFDGWCPTENGGMEIHADDKVVHDMQLYAHWTPNKYLVTFDANGGVGGTSDNLDYESAIVVPLVTRDGYTFKGWSSQVAERVPLDGATYTAQWEVNQYRITFNTNGGVGGTSGMQDYGTAIVAPMVTRPGYTFKGWSPSVAATMPANDVTYTAQWAINKYTVTFDANGGVGGRSGTQDYGTAIVTPTVTRPGYTFKGWTPNVAATVPANDVTYTAQWEINQYTVTFDANGGVGGTSGMQDYGTTIVVPMVTRPGYTFKGWSPSVAATVPANDVTYTAQWAINKYTVTFDANGGVGGTSGKQDYGTAIVAPMVTRPGYTFKGWSPSVAATVPANDVTYTAQWAINKYTVTFDANGGVGGRSGTQDYGTAIVTPTVTRPGYTFKGWSPSVAATVPANDVTYTAQWTPNKYTVTFDTNGGTGGTSAELDYGSTLAAPTVTRTGYTFKGWSPSVAATVPLGGSTYTAQWQINQYTVTFNANGGVGGKSGMQNYGTAIVAPTVTRTGYTFKGWSPNVAETVPASDVTYTAQWELNKYIVTLDAAGGTCSQSTLNVEHGRKIGELPVPTRTKAAFLGWFTEAEGGERVDASLTITVPITLYAHWLTEVASPIVATDGGTLFRTDSCIVTITCETEGVSIYYTADGTTPRKTADYLYTRPITISETTVFKAVAVIGDAQSAYSIVTITKKLLTLDEALDGDDKVTVETGRGVPWKPILDSGAKIGDTTARSGEIGNSTNTWMSATVSGAGTMSFWCKVSCEHDDDNTFTWDRLMVYTNDIEVVEWRMDGETDWTRREVSFAGGENTVKWVYFKDRSISEGEDCAWVDGVTWTLADVAVDVGGGKSVLVPMDWIEAHSNIVMAVGGDKSVAMKSTAANGRKVWECYVLGLDPEKTSDFKITSFPLKSDGTPDIDNIVFDPPQAKWNVPATYKVMGAADLGGPWEDVPDGGGRGATALPLRFFKVIVELP